MRLSPPLVLALLAMCVPSCVTAQDTAAERRIEAVVDAAYVQGLFVDRDIEAVRQGFHPDFVMSLVDDGNLVALTLDTWLGQMGLDGVPSENTVRAEYVAIDVTGSTATAELRLYIDGHHTYTDYLGLYRFEEGWRIVNKVFEAHE